MATFSSLGIGLSFLFGCVLLAFIGEVYYLLWWKKKTQDIENQNFSSSTQFSCFKNTNSSRIPKAQQKSLHESDENQEKQQQEVTQKDSPLKGFGEESVDLELMRLHNLCGPPRFLFTINEETKEDLEKATRKSISCSLSELLCTPETPMSSSLIKSGEKVSNLEGFLNPLYDIDSEFDFNKIRSSPPPTFKFLRDAEEKLLKRLMELEAVKKASLMQKDEKINGSNLVKVDGNNKGKSEDWIHHDHHQMSTTPSQVLPLASSPPK